MRGRRRSDQDTLRWVRAYAGAAGAVLIALGAAGLLLSPGRSPAGSLFQFWAGALFVYAGLVQRDPVVSRRFVGGMGVLLLLGAGATAFARLLLGDASRALGPVQASCLAVGFLSVLVARRAEPGVLLAAVSAFVAAVRTAVATRTTRVRHRRRDHAASSEDPVPQNAEERRGEEPEG